MADTNIVDGDQIMRDTSSPTSSQEHALQSTQESTPFEHIENAFTPSPISEDGQVDDQKPPPQDHPGPSPFTANEATTGRDNNSLNFVGVFNFRPSLSQQRGRQSEQPQQQAQRVSSIRLFILPSTATAESHRIAHYCRAHATERRLRREQITNDRRRYAGKWWNYALAQEEEDESDLEAHIEAYEARMRALPPGGDTDDEELISESTPEQMARLEEHNANHRAGGISTDIRRDERQVQDIWRTQWLQR